MKLPRPTQARHVTPFEGVIQMADRFPNSGPGATMRAAVLALVADYKLISETNARVGADRTLNDASRLIRQAKLAKSKLTAATSRMDKARADVAELRAHYTRETSKPFDFADARFADVALAQEIRAHIKSLPMKDRIAAVSAAINSKDTRTLVALGSVPAYLAGIPDQMHTLVRERVLAEAAPDAVQGLQALDEAQSAADQIEQTILQSVANAVDFDSADAFERDAVASAAAA